MDRQTGKELPPSRNFVAYLQAMANLDALDRMTNSLDQELADSQQAMADLKSMFVLSNEHAQNSENENVSTFLEAGASKLLLPDMVETNANVDLENMILSLRCYTEEIKKSIVSSPSPPKVANNAMQSLDATLYAQSLEHLSERLANIKLNKKQDGNRDIVLEGKLGQLCQDVDIFTQLIQTKTKVNETNENWKESQLKGSALQYEEIINKLLSSINEVSYLLHNRN